VRIPEPPAVPGRRTPRRLRKPITAVSLVGLAGRGRNALPGLCRAPDPLVATKQGRRAECQGAQEGSPSALGDGVGVNSGTTPLETREERSRRGGLEAVARGCVEADGSVTDPRVADPGKKFDSVIYRGAGHGFMRTGEQPDAAPSLQSVEPRLPVCPLHCSRASSRCSDRDP